MNTFRLLLKLSHLSKQRTNIIYLLKSKSLLFCKSLNVFKTRKNWTAGGPESLGPECGFYLYRLLGLSTRLTCWLS